MRWPWRRAPRGKHVRGGVPLPVLPAADGSRRPAVPAPAAAPPAPVLARVGAAQLGAAQLGGAQRVGAQRVGAQLVGAQLVGAQREVAAPVPPPVVPARGRRTPETPVAHPAATPAPARSPRGDAPPAPSARPAAVTVLPVAVATGLRPAFGRRRSQAPAAEPLLPVPAEEGPPVAAEPVPEPVPELLAALPVAADPESEPEPLLLMAPIVTADLLDDPGLVGLAELLELAELAELTDLPGAGEGAEPDAEPPAYVLPVQAGPVDDPAPEDLAAGPRVELGFRDGSVAELDPASEAFLALEALAAELSGTD